VKIYKTWDLLLPTAVFTYNSSVNRTIGISPFEVVHGYRPRQPIDLILRHIIILECLSQLHHLHRIFMNCIKKSTLKFRKIMQTMKLMQIYTRRLENFT